jgi:hypothetical protein
MSPGQSHRLSAQTTFNLLLLVEMFIVVIEQNYY